MQALQESRRLLGAWPSTALRQISSTSSWTCSSRMGGGPRLFRMPFGMVEEECSRLEKPWHGSALRRPGSRRLCRYRRPPLSGLQLWVRAQPGRPIVSRLSMAVCGGRTTGDHERRRPLPGNALKTVGYRGVSCFTNVVSSPEQIGHLLEVPQWQPVKALDELSRQRSGLALGELW